MKVAERPIRQVAVDFVTRRTKHRRPRTPRQERMNVGSIDRVASIAVGSLLALLGMRRGRIPGMITAGLGGGLIYRGLAGHSLVYDKMGVSTIRKEQDARPEDYFERGIHVEEACTINKPPHELYQFWRNFENLPQVMTYLQSVQVIDDKRSRWVVRAPKLANVEWEAEIINDEPNSIIAWRSLPGSTVDNAGSVRFVPGRTDRGTEVHVVIDYIPPAGRVGRLIARLFGDDPQQLIRSDLRNFKRMMETGEKPTIQGQPRGTCTGSRTRHMVW